MIMAEEKIMYENELFHYGILGMKWGVRRYQNPDGSYTQAGRARYDVSGKKLNPKTMDERSLAKSTKRLQMETQYKRALKEADDTPAKQAARKAGIATLKAGASFVLTKVTAKGWRTILNHRKEGSGDWLTPEIENLISGIVAAQAFAGEYGVRASMTNPLNLPKVSDVFKPNTTSSGNRIDVPVRELMSDRLDIRIDAQALSREIDESLRADGFPRPSEVRYTETRRVHRN